MKKQTKNLLKLEHKVLFVFRENKQQGKNNHITDIFDTTTGTTLTSTTVPTTAKTTGIF